VPFVVIQVLMIGLTIAFPQMVMHYKGAPVDPGDIQIIVPPPSGEQPGLPGELGLPPLGSPPGLGTPPADGGGQQQSAPPAIDLSQPPKFN
jgi:hypothetical protein